MDTSAFEGRGAHSITDEGEDRRRLRMTKDSALTAAREAVRDATRLTRLLTVLNDSGTLDALLERALSTLSELFAAEVVILLDPAGTGSYAPLASVGLPDDAAISVFSDDPDGNIARTMREGGPLLLQDVGAEGTVEPQLAELDVETVIYLPVAASHGARGVLILARCLRRAFDYAEVGLLTAMAYRIGLAVEQAQRRAQLERIVHSEREIGFDLEEIGVAAKAVAMFPELVGADGAVLVLLDDDGGILHRTDGGIPALCDEALGELVRHLLATTRLSAFEAHSTVFRPGPDGAATGRSRSSGRALLALPVGHERLDGLLLALRTTATPFDPDILPIAMLFAGQSAAAIENARLYRAVSTELNDRKRAEAALKASEERQAALIRSVHDLIVVLGPDGAIHFTNPAATAVWGEKAIRDSDGAFWSRICPRHIGEFREIFTRLLDQPGATRTCAVALYHSDHDRHDYDVVLTNLLHEPAIGGVVVTFHDVTERKSHERQLEVLAFRDPLTGLANRAAFQDRLKRVLAEAGEPGRSIAVIFFDLDDFKVVNDSLGHEAGDRILQAVAARMRTVLRRGDLGARLGGDEFTVLIDTDAGLETARHVAMRLLAVVGQPVAIGDRDVTVGGSFGIALGEPGRDSAEELLRRADVAMYHAKSSGKNVCCVFDDSLAAAAVRRLEAETDLRRALAHGELEVFFQPIVTLADRRLHGAEALARWRHPERGLVMPSDFIHVAEQTGQIIEVGREVVERAFRQSRAWRALTGASLPIGLNLSPRQLAHEALVDDITSAARRFEVDPRSITLEVTENMLITDPEAAIVVLVRLRDFGFRIAIDDFGTGYSSLSYLKRLPVDILKIDRSFVQTLESDPRDRMIVDSIVAMAGALGLDVIGEGVETVSQAEILTRAGCGYAQGHLFAPALPVADFTRLLPLAELGEGTTGEAAGTAVDFRVRL